MQRHEGKQSRCASYVVNEDFEIDLREFSGSSLKGSWVVDFFASVEDQCSKLNARMLLLKSFLEIVELLDIATMDDHVETLATKFFGKGTSDTISRASSGCY